MAIKIVHPTGRMLEKVDPSTTRAPEDEAQRSRRQIINDDYPYVFLASSPANGIVKAHSHSEPEVMVVLEGSVKINEEHCGPGTVAVIPAEETYGLSVGDEELVYLIARPRNARLQRSKND